ncbi:MAG: ribose-5-phosphate isomerase RpiA [Deltaproteobacteria bacterium]|nr:ribose-5-phosphate isomerase RpiA [Deltaproteobacteria bacterium]
MKEAVAEKLAARVKDGERIGVGTGSTVDMALTKIGERIKNEGLNLQVVPTSLQSAWRCQEIGLTVLYPAFNGELSWGFDGADAVDSNLWLIKGKGGALLQEKILAAKCNHFVVIVDDSKMTDDLSKACAIPVEVIPEARMIAERQLERLNATGIELRPAVGKHGPIITEAGNIILDVTFKSIDKDLERNIKSIVGVVESGLFIGYANEVIVAGKSGIQVLTPG